MSRQPRAEITCSCGREVRWFHFTPGMPYLYCKCGKELRQDKRGETRKQFRQRAVKYFGEPKGKE